MTRLRLRRGRVTRVELPGQAARLSVEVAGVRRPAVAYTELTGPVEVGDEVVVNVAALDLALGSGGFDVVHVNLTRGLDAPAAGVEHVMKLNYSSLQHPVAVLEERAAPLEEAHFAPDASPRVPAGRSVAVLALHGGLTALGWHGAVVGPGPGIAGSGSLLGHGGMAALDSAHTALALGIRTILVPRMSSADPRPRHRGLSHHSATVLELLLRPVLVALPEGAGPPLPGAHEPRAARADLAGYASSGLPAHTMGRALLEDELFFRAALAGGTLLGEEIDGL